MCFKLDKSIDICESSSIFLFAAFVGTLVNLNASMIVQPNVIIVICFYILSNLPLFIRVLCSVITCNDW